MILREAKIGLIVKPPRTAMYAFSGQLLLWARSYRVIRKDPKNKCVWLNVLKHMVEYVDAKGNKFLLPAETSTAATERLGSIQVDEAAEWLLETDPEPSDKIRVFRTGEPSDEPNSKRRRGGPDATYEFAFDVDEISLDGMPGQAQIIAEIFLEIYNADGTQSWTEKEIEEILRREENVDRLHTTQDPMTIFRFYRSQYAKRGFINRKD